MKNIGRLLLVSILFCGVLVLAANSWAQTRAPILEQVAKTYGVDSWDKIEAIRYTWNGDIGEILLCCAAAWLSIAKGSTRRSWRGSLTAREVCP